MGPVGGARARETTSGARLSWAGGDSLRPASSTPLIRDAVDLEPVLAAIRGGARVAVDTEFHSERHFHPRLMLVQLRVDDGPAFLVDPVGGLDLRPLGEALSAAPLLLLHGGTADLQILAREAGLRPGRVFDTQIAAGCAGDGYPIRLQELLRRHLDIHVPKAETLSDWSRRPLSPEQARYAADDVLLLGPLADALAARLDALGNAAVAAACTAELVVRALRPEADGDAWRGVPGAHLLEPGERTVLQGLAAWRDRAARDRDQPRPSVLSDAMLLDLARRQPATLDALRANRRFPSQVWRKDGEAVLSVIAGAQGQPAPPPLHRHVHPWIDLVNAAARVAERSRGVAPELCLDDAALSEIAAGRAPVGWRGDALGPDFVEFLSGRRSVALPGLWKP